MRNGGQLVGGSVTQLEEQRLQVVAFVLSKRKDVVLFRIFSHCDCIDKTVLSHLAKDWPQSLGFDRFDTLGFEFVWSESCQRILEHVVFVFAIPSDEDHACVTDSRQNEFLVTGRLVAGQCELTCHHQGQYQQSQLRHLEARPECVDFSRF